VPHLEPYPHHRGPLDVVGLSEDRPPAAGTGVPDNGMDPMVTMVPVRGGRVTPPLKAAVSVNPAASAFTPVWAAAAVRDTAAAPPPPPPGAPPTRPLPSGLPPRRPWGCAAAHCATCSRAACLASLSSLSLPSSAETELPVLLVRRVLSSVAAAAASTSALATASYTITSLVALTTVAAVSIVARSRSSAVATSASCRCCTLEATERRDCPSDMTR
jgi:hypothetical protein